MVFMFLIKLSLAFLQVAAFTPAVVTNASHSVNPVTNPPHSVNPVTNPPHSVNPVTNPPHSVNPVTNAPHSVNPVTNVTSPHFSDNNVTAMNPLEQLDEANRRFKETLIPCTAYIGFLIVIGIIGNSLVFYVFSFRLKRSPQNFFILLLAVLDLLSCTIGLPAEVTDITLHFKFESAALCKVMRCVNSFAAMGSIFTLIVIAVDRYRRVRKPLHPQITLHQARLCLIPILLLALTFAAPSIYVYGLRTIESGFPGVYGLDCTISDQAKLTIFPLIYNSILFLCFIILATSLIVMYSLILRSLKEHAKLLRKMSTCTSSTLMESLSINETVSANEESGSSAHVTDCDHARKQRVPTSPNSTADVLSVNIPNLGSGGGDDVFFENDSGYLSNDCNQLETVDVKDSAHVVSNDFFQKNITDGKKMRPMENVGETDTDGPGNDINTTNQIDTCHFEVLVQGSDSRGEADSQREESRGSLRDVNKDCEADSGPDTDSEEGCQTKENNITQGIGSGHTDITPKRPSLPHHVSFNVSCLTATKTDLPDLKTSPYSVTSVRSPSKRKLSETSMSRELEGQSEKYVNHILQLQKNKEHQDRSRIQNRDSQKDKKQETETPKQRQYTRKTTIIAFVVTLVFIISFVPHLCLQVTHIIRKGFDEELQGAPLALYNIFLRSYFINSVANPIIYGVLNETFRAEVKLLIKWLHCCRNKR